MEGDNDLAVGTGAIGGAASAAPAKVGDSEADDL